MEARYSEPIHFAMHRYAVLRGRANHLFFVPRDGERAPDVVRNFPTVCHLPRHVSHLPRCLPWGRGAHDQPRAQHLGALRRRELLHCRRHGSSVHLHDAEPPRVHPPDKEVLKGIWLSFYPGAKIGVLGGNGAGKARCCASWPASTRTSSARREPRRGLTIGYLPQEPQLDPSKNVLENVEEGVAETSALLKRFEEISMKLGED